MKREDIIEQIVTARLAEGADLAAARGAPLASPSSGRPRHCSGSIPVPAELGTVVVEMLRLDGSAVPVLAAVPMRGELLTAVPTDPTIYRFYEVAAGLRRCDQGAHPRAVCRRGQFSERHQLQRQRGRRKVAPFRRFASSSLSTASSCPTTGQRRKADVPIDHRLRTCWESLKLRLRRAATACALVVARAVGPSIRSSPI